jgi:7,8-dihydropterin-6-yl-methyl-4-(beta-D-ribofuranosyl)aminobenzene 5'-phosphate synthase
MSFTKNIINLVLISFIIVNAKANSLTNTKNQDSIQVNNDSIKITVLYDNYVHLEGTQADWGFSCLLENNENTILFDTGTNPDILIKNADMLNIDLSQVDIVVISHNHLDHTGGLFKVLEQAKNAKVYLPYSTPDEYVQKIEKTGALSFSEKDSIQICKKFYLTGELGDKIKEQSLIIDTKNGLVVITGCSHPGIVNIVETAKDKFGKEVYMVLGGFHLLDHSKQMVSEIITELKNLGVKKCGATHCTGDEAIQLFKTSFGDNFFEMGTGQIINVSS